MSEWQPARLHNPHKIDDSPNAPELYRKVVKARPCPIERVSPITLVKYSIAGCDSQKFFEIDPLDGDLSTYTGCEHEVLVD
jgi:hypothetical protein